MGFETAILQIKKSNKILIFPHIYADGDALGSSLALALALSKMGKKVKVIIEEPISYLYKFLDFKDLFTMYDYEKEMFKEEIYNEEIVCIALDTSDIGRLGKRADAFISCPKTINIDHHKTNSKYAQINIINSNASSVGEMVFDLIEGLNVKINKDIAKAIYVAISTDTGGFKYSNTGSKAHAVASKVIKYDIDISNISRLLYDVRPLRKVKLIEKAIKNIEILHKGKICIMSLRNKDFINTKTTEEDTEQIVNIGLDIEGVEFAALIKENIKGEIKVNLRSVKEIDVSKLAGKFGGGGHIRAAGFRAKKNFDIIKKEIISIAEKMIKG